MLFIYIIYIYIYIYIIYTLFSIEITSIIIMLSVDCRLDETRFR